MNRLNGLMFFVGVICVLSVAARADDNEPQEKPAGELNFSMATLVEKFGGAGRPQSISIDPNPNATYSLAICDDSNQLHVIYKESGRWKRITEKLKGSSTPRILLKDLNGDGNNEVLICSDKLRIYKVEQQRLTLAWTSAEDFGVPPPPQLGVADFNGDGQLDVAVLNYMGGKFKDRESLYIYLHQQEQNSNYQLAGTTTFTDMHGYHSTAAMAIADFFGDHHPEIVVGNDDGFLWLVKIEESRLTVRHQWEVPSGGAVGPGLAAGNFDLDEKSELSIGTNGGDIFVADFASDGIPTFVASAHAGRLAYGVSTGDFNDDGRDEFVLTRGLLGYAGMDQLDVVAEVWQLENGQLDRVWQQTTVDCPRPLVRATQKEILVYSLTSEGKFFEVLKPSWKK